MSLMSVIVTPAMTRVHRVTAQGAPATLVMLMLLSQVAAREAVAQAGSPERQWRGALEIGATASATWLDGGTGAPEITSSPGLHIGAGVQRGLSSHVAGGVMLRYQQSSLDIGEAGVTWDGGAVRELDVMAIATYQPRIRGSLRWAIDAGAGVSQVHAPNNLLPFTNASRVLPVAELGATLRHGSADGPVSRRELLAFARYSTLLLRVNGSDALGEGGTVARIIFGVGVVR